MKTLENPMNLTAYCGSAQTALVGNINDHSELYLCGWKGGEPILNPKLIRFPHSKLKVLKVSLGVFHVLVLVSNQHELLIYSWGSNDKGQLGHGDTLDRDTPCLIQFASSKLISDIQACEKSSAFLTSSFFLSFSFFFQPFLVFYFLLNPPFPIS